MASLIAQDVCDPETGLSIKTMGLLREVQVKDTNNVSVTLDMRVPGYPQEDRIVDLCKQVISRLDWVKSLNVDVVEGSTTLHPDSAALAKVRHIIGISSCKGGVGKSTTAMLIASALRDRGLKVGLLDADVYGPSLPFLANVPDLTVRRDPTASDYILPLEDTQGLKVLSFGYVNPRAGAPGAGGHGAAIMRGPVASRVINQLLHKTSWGELDYLLVDMPPGTGDVQITLTQAVSFTGVVIVTTPHLLSVADVAKGIEMFDGVKVPTLSVIENMAFFECTAGVKYYPFGKGGRESVLSALRGDRVDGGGGALRRIEECPYHSIPLSRGDNRQVGPRSSMSLSEEETAVFDEVACSMINEVMMQTVLHSAIPVIKLRDDTLALQYFDHDRASELHISMAELRRRDPKTGETIPNASVVEARIVDFDFQGNYGVAFHWSDGHYADIFTFDALYKIGMSSEAKA